MHGDRLGDAGRTVAALDLDHRLVGDAQPVRRYLGGFPDAAAQARAGRNGPG